MRRSNLQIIKGTDMTKLQKVYRELRRSLSKEDAREAVTSGIWGDGRKSFLFGMAASLDDPLPWRPCCPS